MSYQNETNSSRPWNKDKIFHMISKPKKTQQTQKITQPIYWIHTGYRTF